MSDNKQGVCKNARDRIFFDLVRRPYEKPALTALTTSNSPSSHKFTSTNEHGCATGPS